MIKESLFILFVFLLVDSLLERKLQSVHPVPNAVYQLSNARQHVYALAIMQTYDTIDHFVFIDYNKGQQVFCKYTLRIETPILASFAASNADYYAIKWYGNSYFSRPSAALLRIMSVPLSQCMEQTQQS